MINKKYNRNIKLKFLLFHEKNKIKKLNFKKFLKKYKVQDLIKFPRNDFKYLNEKKKFLHILIYMKQFIREEKNTW